jgi:hypothetical protein
MSFVLFLISIAILDQLLLRKNPTPKQAPKSEILPPKSKAAGSGSV